MKKNIKLAKGNLPVGQSPGHHGLKIFLMQIRSVYKGTMWSSQVVFLSGQNLKGRMREGAPKVCAVNKWEGSESLMLRILYLENHYHPTGNLPLANFIFCRPHRATTH